MDVDEVIIEEIVNKSKENIEENEQIRRSKMHDQKILEKNLKFEEQEKILQMKTKEAEN